MALTPSQDLAFGTSCPNFELRSVTGETYSLDDFKLSRVLLVAFICNHCPYVRAIEEGILTLSRQFSSEQLQVIAICSNDSTRYPDDGPDALLARWKEKNYRFPYLIDSTQQVAKAFDAVCTPDLFLYDSERKLYYHGRFEDLESAVLDCLAAKPSPKNQKHSIGCSIKWFV